SCRDGSRMLIERHDTKTVVVLDASTGVRHTERSLPGRLHAADRTAGVFPAPDTVGLAVLPGCRRIEAWVRDRVDAIRRPAAAGYSVAVLVPALHAQHAVVAFRHDQVIPQVPILDGQLVQAAPVAACLDESQP